ncbi:putative cytochrome protein B [Toxoplasma gondii VAND]|uniref:Putative cytochrome protein B n=1 Tax=Toxoplasma gondii VAND TaxID=933077 RepID=A0A086PH96_TOXGO|nr:putative cytochrome protein B [Toxoplasma gondii VAND]
MKSVWKKRLDSTTLVYKCWFFKYTRFVTPLHSLPEWYFIAYYAVLKVFPSQIGGLLVFMSSLINLSLLSEIRALNTRMLIRQQFMTRNVVGGWVIIRCSGLASEMRVESENTLRAEKAT